MGPNPTGAAFLEYFKRVPDPRSAPCLHPLESVLVLCLCAIISGADGPTSIEEFGQHRLQWLRRLAPFPNGVPSHDTIGRILGMLSPMKLAETFVAWTQGAAQQLPGEVVAIDGKSLRRARNMGGGDAFVHMVTAFATSNGMVLGQVKSDDKSNEITAIPRLLDLLVLKGCIVTIDAMGCQKKVVEKIRKNGADYVIAVKENQPALLLAVATATEALDSKKLPSGATHHETTDVAHGRKERRQCWTLPVPPKSPLLKEWPSVRTLIRITAERKVGSATATVTVRWYISSCERLPAKRALAVVRSHWTIENQLHWLLDVVFNEDQSRLRADNAAENLVVIRHAAVNLLRAAPTAGPSINLRRKNAGWNPNVLEAILQSSSFQPREIS